jgi:hypothetical protein
LDKDIQNCFVRLDTLKFGVYDVVFCFDDGVAKKNNALNLLGLKSGSNTVSALKQISVETILKAEIAALSI